MKQVDDYVLIILKEFIEENWSSFVDRVGSEEEAEKLIVLLNV
jgi:hypothetical protein